MVYLIVPLVDDKRKRERAGIRYDSFCTDGHRSAASKNIRQSHSARLRIVQTAATWPRTTSRRPTRHRPTLDEQTSQWSPARASFWRGRRKGHRRQGPIWTSVRRAGVKAVSPARRGRSVARRLDAGEHTAAISLNGATPKWRGVVTVPADRRNGTPSGHELSPRDAQTRAERGAVTQDYPTLWRIPTLSMVEAVASRVVISLKGSADRAVDSRVSSVLCGGGSVVGETDEAVRACRGGPAGWIQGCRRASRAAWCWKAKCRVAAAMLSKRVRCRMTASAMLVQVALLMGANRVRARQASSAKVVSRM